LTALCRDRTLPDRKAPLALKAPLVQTALFPDRKAPLAPLVQTAQFPDLKAPLAQMARTALFPDLKAQPEPKARKVSPARQIRRRPLRLAASTSNLDPTQKMQSLGQMVREIFCLVKYSLQVSRQATFRVGSRLTVLGCCSSVRA
jgi:hypothetical protein